MTQTESTTTNQEYVPIFVGEIIICQTIGKLLYQFPERDDIFNLVQEDIFSQLPMDTDQPEVEKGLNLLKAFTNKLRDQFSDQHFDDIRADYTRLFIGPGKVLAPPWESVYYSEERLVFQEQTLKVRAWYRRFALEAEKIHNEPDDHIGLELAFLAHLASLGLQAIENQDEGALNNTLEAQRQFLREHPLKWARLWCELVDEHAQTDFYRGLALLTWGVLKEIAALLEVEMPKEVVRWT
ncbi:MAG: molecular chaperone TorD family protein [Anaerolineales bacterium]|nr:molecular chaperone TorD family protein [Anaerolineales bacterium]